MKIQVNKTVSEEVEITLPYFFKTSAHWVAILSEEEGIEEEVDLDSQIKEDLDEMLEPEMVEDIMNDISDEKYMELIETFLICSFLN